MTSSSLLRLVIYASVLCCVGGVTGRFASVYVDTNKQYHKFKFFLKIKHYVKNTQDVLGVDKQLDFNSDIRQIDFNNRNQSNFRSKPNRLCSSANTCSVPQDPDRNLTVSGTCYRRLRNNDELCFTPAVPNTTELDKSLPCCNYTEPLKTVVDEMGIKTGPVKASIVSSMVLVNYCEYVNCWFVLVGVLVGCFIPLWKRVKYRSLRMNTDRLGMKRPFEIQVCLNEISPRIYRKYGKLCDLKQRVHNIHFRNKHEAHMRPFPSKNIRIIVQGCHEFDQVRLRTKYFDSSDGEEKTSLPGTAVEEGTDDSSDSYDGLSSSSEEIIEISPSVMPIMASPYDTGKKNSILLAKQLNTVDNEDTLKPETDENIYKYPQLSPKYTTKSCKIQAQDTANLRRRSGLLTKLDKVGDSYNEQYLKNESCVVKDPYQVLVIEIEDTTEIDQMIFSWVEGTLVMSSGKTINQIRIDRDSIIVVDVHYQDVDEGVRIFITDRLKKVFKIHEMIDFDFKEQVSVGCYKHNIYYVVCSMILKRLEREFQAIKTVLEHIGNNNQISQFMIREINWHLGISEDEREDVVGFDDLREQLFKLPCVFAIGIFDGEMHIQTVTKETKQSDKIDIERLMEGTEYQNAYYIVPYNVTPEYLMFHKPISYPLIYKPKFESKGTIGCFLQDNEGTIYALTAAHTFQPNGTNVYINGDNLLGIFDQQLSGWYVKMEDGMDFALVATKSESLRGLETKLLDENKNRCSTKLMSHNSDIRWDLPVYKYGITTGRTYGVLIDEEHYKIKGQTLYFVKHLEGSRPRIFAKKGDSGAIICQYDERRNVVVAISLLSRKRRMPINQGKKMQKIYSSVPLKNVIEILQERTGKTFHIMNQPI